MLKAFVFAALISCSLATTTTMKPHHSHASHASHSHASKPTHEPNVNHKIVFRYDHTTHMITLRVGQTCYFQPLDSQQQLDIHTDHGLFTIEKILIDKYDTGAPTSDMSHDDLMMTSPAMAKFCPAKYTLKKFM